MKRFTRDDTTPRARTRWARSIEHLIADADRRERYHPYARPIYRKDVVRACAPALTEIRWVLVEQETTVRPEAMARLRQFLTDGAASPLHRDDALAARRAAHEIASAFVVPAAVHVPAPAREHAVRA